MREDVPSPGQLNGAKFWTEATFALDGHEHTSVVSAGNLVWQADQEITKISGLVIPSTPDGVDVVAAGLVGSDGHTVRLTCHATTTSAVWEWDIGTFLAVKAHKQGPRVTCELESLNTRVIEHQAPTPTGVGQANRCSWIVRAILAEDGIDLVIDDELGDVTVPSDFTIGTDRSASLKELLTAWNAILIPDPTGVMRAARIPVGDITTVVATFTPGETLIDAPLELSRDGVYNDIVIDIADTVGAARATQHTGKYAVETFGWRTKRLQSAAVTNATQGQLVARAELAQALRRTVTVPVEAYPDWRLEPFDPVAVHSPDVSGWGRITGLDRSLVGGSTVYHIGMEV